MTIIRLQPAAFTDQITDDGQELTKLPYPFFADEQGMIGRQDVWHGDPYRVVGFQRDLFVQQLDLSWGQAFKDPSKAVGMYLITASKAGVYGVHTTAIESAEVEVPR
jgi:hypothetical protein